uniref:Ig-like domain-containing protein n=1 Tax=Catharus ustulatus TaxID=91951 RepID=A0A8C3U314_CATUS
QSHGSSMTLLCRGSGFNFESFGMGWICQSHGKELEFVAGVSRKTGKIYYEPSVKGRFILSTDDGQSSMRLFMNSLKDEDAGVYFCAKNLDGYCYSGAFYCAWVCISTSGHFSPIQSHLSPDVPRPFPSPQPLPQS